MRTRLTIASLTAMTIAGVISLNAQTPQTRPQQTQPQTTQTQTDRQRPSTDQTRADTSTQSVTVQGCLRAEKDVPGRRPSVTERAGINEDYILTNVKMSPGSKTSGLGLGSMYQIKGVSESELKNHAGHQVEVMGTLSNTGSGMSGTSGRTAGATGATGATGGTTGSGASGQRGSTGSNAQGGNRNSDDVPELQATSIKMVSQTCAAQ